MLPVLLHIQDVYPNGLMQILFSEELKSLAELKSDNLRLLKEDFLDVKFKSNLDGGCSPLAPDLVDWYVTKFDNDKMELFLNISNPIYVSSSDVQDEIKVTVKNPFVF